MVYGGFKSAGELYGLRKLIVLPFRFVGSSLGAALPFYLLLLLAFLANPIRALLMPGTTGTSVETAFTVLTLGLSAFTLCAMFAVILTAAANHTLGRQESPLSAMEIAIKIWPKFVEFICVTCVYGVLFVHLIAGDVKDAIDTVSTGSISEYVKAIGEGLVEPLTNPLMYGFGVLSAVYFGFFARKAIAMFESNLEAMELRKEGDPSMAAVFADNKTTFVLLASIPHLILGICLTFSGMVLPKGSYGDLLSSMAAQPGNIVTMVGGAALFCLALSLMMMVQGGFVSAIWMTAAERAGLLDLESLDEPVTDVRASAPRATVGQAAAKPMGPVTFGQKSLNGSQGSSVQPGRFSGR